MKTIALFVVGLAGWLAPFTFGQESTQDAAIEASFMDSAVRATTLWPDMDVPESRLQKRALEIWARSQENPKTQWLLDCPERPMILAVLAAWELGVVPVRTSHDEDRLNQSEARAKALWPDLAVAGSRMHTLAASMMNEAETNAATQWWLVTSQERPMIVAIRAAWALGMAPGQSDPLPALPISVPQVSGPVVTAVPNAPQPAPQTRVIILPPYELEFERRLRLEREAAANAPSRASERLLDSRISDIQRQLRKLERR